LLSHRAGSDQQRGAGTPARGNLWLRLLTSGARLELSVRDDGGGFDLAAARRRAAAGASLGSPVWRSALRWQAAPSSCARRPDKAPNCWHHSLSSRPRKHKPLMRRRHPGRTRR